MTEEVSNQINETQAMDREKKETFLTKYPVALIFFSLCFILPSIGGVIWAIRANRDPEWEVFAWVFFGIGAGVLLLLVGLSSLLLFLITRKK